jgi:hypothetical protein
MISTTDLPELSNSDQLLFMLTLYFYLISNKSILIKRSTTSVRIPCFIGSADFILYFEQEQSLTLGDSPQ